MRSTALKLFFSGVRLEKPQADVLRDLPADGVIVYTSRFRCTFPLLFAHRKHSDLVDLRIADYSSLKSILASLQNLNRVLEANSEDLRVSLEDLELVFSQLAPIIAINNMRAFVGKAPNEAQLLDAIARHQAHLT